MGRIRGPGSGILGNSSRILDPGTGVKFYGVWTLGWYDNKYRNVPGFDSTVPYCSVSLVDEIRT